MFQRPALTVVWALIAVGASAVAYLPITKCFFYADDFIDLYTLGNGTLRTFLLTSGGGHLEPVRNAIFMACWMAFYHEPAGYFWAVLGLHAIVVTLVYAIVLRWTQRASVAGLTSLLFGTCTVHVETLGWLSVAGQVMAAALVAATLLDVADRTRGNDVIRFRSVARWAALLLAASMCFGSGTAIAVVFPLLLLILVPSGQRTRPELLLASVTAIVVLGAWVVMVVPSLPKDTLGTGMKLTAILVKPPIVTSVALVHLLGAGIAGLLLGPLYDRSAYPGVLSVGADLGYAGLLLLALRLGTTAQRRMLLGLLLLTCSAYAATALARAPLWMALKPDVDMAAVATIPRYHYLPQMLLALQLGLGLAVLLERFRSARRRFDIVAASAAVVLLAGVWLAPAPIDFHAPQRRAVTNALTSLERTASQRPRGSVVRVPNAGWNHGLFIRMPPEMLPGLAALYIAFSPNDDIDGRSIRFEARSQEELRAHDAGGRIARLLVSPNASTEPKPR